MPQSRITRWFGKPNCLLAAGLALWLVPIGFGLLEDYLYSGLIVVHGFGLVLGVLLGLGFRRLARRQTLAGAVAVIVVALSCCWLLRAHLYGAVWLAAFTVASLAWTLLRTATPTAAAIGLAAWLFLVSTHGAFYSGTWFYYSPDWHPSGWWSGAAWCVLGVLAGFCIGKSAHIREQLSIVRTRPRYAVRAALLVIGAALAITPTAVLVHHNRPPRISVPGQRLIRVNSSSDFLSIGRRISAPFRGGSLLLFKDVQEWPPSQLKDVSRLTTPALPHFRRALVKPYLCIHKPWSWERTRHRSTYDTCEGAIKQALLAQSELHRRRWEYGEAARCALDCVEFGVVLGHGQRAESTEEYERGGLEQFCRLLDELSPSELANAADRLDRITARREPLTDRLREAARRRAEDSVRWYRNDHIRLWSLEPWVWFDGCDGCGWKSNLLRLWEVFADKEATICLNMAYDQAVIQALRGPYTCTPRLPALRWPRLNRFEWDGPAECWMVARTRARMLVVQTEVAIRRYRADHHSPPRTLSDLVPAYLPSVPIDPCRPGHPLCYALRVHGRKCVPYSVGPEMKDDGCRADDISLKSIMPRPPSRNPLEPPPGPSPPPAGASQGEGEPTPISHED